MYKKIDALDKEVKPLILKWLSKQFGYINYPHSFKDQWINWNVNNGEICVGFDLRQNEQVKLLSLIPTRFLGTPQRGTLKIVNDQNFYLQLNRITNIEYPSIEKSVLLKKEKHTGGKGGWISASDSFYTYDWEVFLSDGSSVYYHNQKDFMDMKEGDSSYNSIIHERAFVSFLKTA